MASFFSDVASVNKFYFPEPLILLKKVSQKRRVKKRVKRRVKKRVKKGVKKWDHYRESRFLTGNPDSLPGIQIFWLVGRV